MMVKDVEFYKFWLISGKMINDVVAINSGEHTHTYGDLVIENVTNTHRVATEALTAKHYESSDRKTVIIFAFRLPIEKCYDKVPSHATNYKMKLAP